MTVALPLDCQAFLGHNQETYAQLKQSLGLNLRRQLLLAVCDDLTLQQQLAQRLETDLGSTPTPVPLATLTLSAHTPDLVQPVLVWLKKHHRLSPQAGAIPAFQIVGIDQLTRQSPTLQNRFLASLLRVEALLSSLDCRLLVWVPRPWLGKIRQAVPGFWRSRSGLFEFAGDPTPSVPSTPKVTMRAALSRASQITTAGMPEHPSVDPSEHAPKVTLVPTPVSKSLPAPPTVDQAQLWHTLEADLDALEPLPPALPAPSVEPLPGNLVADATLMTRVMSPDAMATSEAAPPPPVTEHREAECTEHGADSMDQVMDRSCHPGGQPSVAPDLPPTPTKAEVPASQLPPLPPLPAPWNDHPQAQVLWQQAQTLTTYQAGRLPLARVCLPLAQLVRDHLDAQTPAPAQMAFAISAYELALPGLSAGTTDWYDTLNDLGSLHWLQAQSAADAPTQVAGLHRSVTLYTTATTHPISNGTVADGLAAASPDSLVRLHSNLAMVHGLLAHLETPVVHLEQAARAYHRALNQRSAQADPQEYGTIQNSLGGIYWRLAQLEHPSRHLHDAITAYAEALNHHPAQAAPAEYAMIQNNLGIAYWSLAQHERPEFLLKQAITAYQAALAYRTLATDSAGCATTHNNLGTAYWDLAQHYRRQPQIAGPLLAQAVEAYETTLVAANRALEQDPTLALGFDLWATFHSAGVVHGQLAQQVEPGDTQTDRQRHHLDYALQHYLLAYQGWQGNAEQTQLLVAALAQILRLEYDLFGAAGQQAAMAQVPGELLSDILALL